jgi:hypothetical protein
VEVGQDEGHQEYAVERPIPAALCRSGGSKWTAALDSKTTVFGTPFSLLIEEAPLGTDRLFQNPCQNQRLINGASVRITAEFAGYKPNRRLKAVVFLEIEAKTVSDKKCYAT